MLFGDITCYTRQFAPSRRRIKIIGSSSGNNRTVTYLLVKNPCLQQIIGRTYPSNARADVKFIAEIYIWQSHAILLNTLAWLLNINECKKSAHSVIIIRPRVAIFSAVDLTAEDKKSKS